MAHAGLWERPRPWLTEPTFRKEAHGPPHTCLCRMSLTAEVLAAAREVSLTSYHRLCHAQTKAQIRGIAYVLWADSLALAAIGLPALSGGDFSA